MANQGGLVAKQGAPLPKLCGAGRKHGGTPPMVCGVFVNPGGALAKFGRFQAKRRRLLPKCAAHALILYRRALKASYFCGTFASRGAIFGRAGCFLAEVLELIQGKNDAA